MGRIAKLVAFITGSNSSSARGDTGGGSIRDADHFSSPGDDAQPLAGDYAAFVESSQSGVFFSVGYIDTGNQKTAQRGEKRIYARDASGTQMCEIHLKNTGEVSLSNDNGSLTLVPAGSVFINGVEITPDGKIITPEGVVLNTHKHPQGSDSNGDAEQDTGGPMNV